MRCICTDLQTVGLIELGRTDSWRWSHHSSLLARDSIAFGLESYAACCDPNLADLRFLHEQLRVDRLFYRRQVFLDVSDQALRRAGEMLQRKLAIA